VRPNLKSSHALTLNFRAMVALSDNQIEQIAAISKPDPEGDHLFDDIYDGHRAWVWVIKPTKPTTEGVHKSPIAFVFQVLKGGRVGRLKKNVPRINQIVEILSSIPDRYDFECQVSFEFGRRLRPKSIFALPLKCPELLNLPFDRVEGLHVSKLDGKKRIYDVLLEENNGAIMEHIMMPYHSAIDDSLPDKILEEARTISSKFIKQG